MNYYLGKKYFLLPILDNTCIIAPCEILKYNKRSCICALNSALRLLQPDC